MPPLQSVTPPFRSDAPPWYNNGVWGQLGCAIPQPGHYLHTYNTVIYEFVDVTGRQMFNTLWGYDDRKFERPPSKDCLWEIYQLLMIGRKRLADRAIPYSESPERATHAKPSPQMFLVYPIPLYGRLGCVQSFLRETAEQCLLMHTEAMQHSDNELAYYVTDTFFQAIAPYMQSVLVTMATKYFGYDRKTASDPVFTIPDDKWKSYNPMQWAVPVEGTSTRPPVGWTPTEEDLEPIRGIPASQAVPFCQPWPDSTLLMSPGGVWAGQPGSGIPAKVPEGGATPSTTNPTTAAFPTPPGPPNG